MNCASFRDEYSDFVDGLIDETGEIEAERHMRQCPTCRRFHESLSWGVRELRRLPQVLPTADFTARVERAVMAERPPAAVAMRQGAVASAVLMSLTLVAAGLFTFDMARRSAPVTAQPLDLGPLPVLGSNAFRPTFRYVTHSVATTAPFAAAAPADAPDLAQAEDTPVILLGGPATR